MNSSPPHANLVARHKNRLPCIGSIVIDQGNAVIVMHYLRLRSALTTFSSRHSRRHYYRDSQAEKPKVQIFSVRDSSKKPIPESRAPIRKMGLGPNRSITHPARGLTDMAFSPDGRSLATSSFDGTAYLWLVWPEDLIAEGCSRIGRNLTAEEWLGYFGDEPYRPTCPDLP